MTTLAELGAAILPAGREVGAVRRDRPIGWVRLMRARVPAFDALEPGDLVIVPASRLAVVAPGPDELRGFAAACAAAGVAGALLIDPDPGSAAGGDATASPDAPVAGSSLDELEAALRTAELPALRLPATDPIALERSVIGYLVTRGAELDRQAALLEARLEQLALDGGGPEALVGAIATFLGRAVALEGRRGTALAVHAPPAVADAAAAIARYHARPRRAVALRIPLPGPGGEAGSLALLGDRPSGELERVAIARIAGFLALELARGEAVRRARDQARRSEALPPAGPPWVVLLARQRRPGEDAGGDARARRDAVRRELRLLAPARRLGLRGDADSLEIRAVLAVDRSGGTDPEGLAVAGQLAAFLERPVALSRPFEAAADRPAAEAEARATLEVAERLREAPALVRASRLAAYRLLVALHNLPEAERAARDLLTPLLAGRPDVRRERLATLRAVLDHGGVSEAAGALAVHRNTVAYRLRGIEAATGWQLADPDLRLALAVAVRLVQAD